MQFAAANLGGFHLTLLGRRQVELWSEGWVGREKLLESLLQLAAENRWFVRVDPGWNEHDVRFRCRTRSRSSSR